MGIVGVLQNSDFANRFPGIPIVGQRIIDKNNKNGIYLMNDPPDAWDAGYFIVIIAADANLALRLNDGVMKYRSAGSDWMLVK